MQELREKIIERQKQVHRAQLVYYAKQAQKKGRYVQRIKPFEGRLDTEDAGYLFPINTRGAFNVNVADIKQVSVFNTETGKFERNYLPGKTNMDVGNKAMGMIFTDFIGDKLQLNKKILETNKQLNKYSNPIRTLLFKRAERMNEYNDELTALFRAHLNQILKTGITLEEAKKKAMKRIEKDIARISKAIDDEFPPKELKEFAKRRDEYNKMTGWNINDNDEVDELLRKRFGNL